METITVPNSVYMDGQWFAAQWAVELVDDSSGELVITATVAGPGAPRVAALRMDMGLASDLRAQAGFVERPAPGGSRVLRYDVAHECNGVRLAELELQQRIDHHTMLATFNDHQEQISSMEKTISSLHEHQVLDARQMHGLANRVDALEYTVGNLQRLAQAVHGPEAGL